MLCGEDIATNGSDWGHGVSVDEAAASLVERFLQALPDAAAPCGPDLEYDNAFLELNQSAAGRPESQWDAGEPANWAQVRTQSEALFERTKDVRVAVLWLRAVVNLSGLDALGPGLKLLHGLLDTYWATVHPLPDPDDNDPFARMNALSVLREPEGLLGDLREALVFTQRGVGELRVRNIEVALNQLPPRADETPLSRGQLDQMLAAAVAQDPGLRPRLADALAQVKALIALLNERAGIEHAVDLKPLWTAVNNVLNVLPAPVEATVESSDDGSDAEAAEGTVAAPRRAAATGLSGSVNSREEAVRAIDMVCEYLERAEPTSPAPLLLRRARRLVNRNFLQLMKELAPDALSEVARVMGVDPETVQLDDAG
jgi:type VI secretion system protein ImpA